MTKLNKPLLIDFFCGAGGGSVGYARSGFDVVGCDSEPQKRYPFDFLQMDALEALHRLLAGESLQFGDRRISLVDVAVVHTSPPCQVYSITAPLSNGRHLDLVAPVRELLLATGKRYVIENVRGAPFVGAPLLLCGSMFDLRVQRHRYFENNFGLWLSPKMCNHWGRASAAGRGSNVGYLPGTLENFAFITVVGNDYIADDGRLAMGIDWMVKIELSQAIPPAYTEFIGKVLLTASKRGRFE